MSYTIEYLPPPKNYIGRALQKLVESLHAGKPHRGLKQFVEAFSISLVIRTVDLGLSRLTACIMIVGFHF